MVDTRTITLAKIPTIGDGLGRHIHHDSRSWAYRVPPKRGTVTSQKWARVSPVLDQLHTSSCVGNACVGVLGSEPFSATLRDQQPALGFDEDEALRVYALATQLDPYDGTFTYPPPGGQDDGSDGLSGAKALVQLGLISGYQHCMSLDDVLTALQDGPVITGVNWYTSFDHPTAQGVVTLTPDATVRGGHEFVISEVDVAARMLGSWQSWGPSWGLAGQFFFSFQDYARLLSEQGDATKFVPITSPAPIPTPTENPDVALVDEARRYVARRHTAAGGNKAMATALSTWMKGKGYH